MNRTVSYQETSNNYSDTRQQINGAQITTIKNFGVAPPAGGGDFVGQLGIASTAQGEALLYTYGIGGVWQLVGKSGTADLPDTVVLEDHKNNFTETDQRIEDCPIVYMEEGTRAPGNVAIKGAGHLYVYKTVPEEVYISYDGAHWTLISSKPSAGDVALDQANNFTNPDQTINGNAIVNVMIGSLPAPNSGISPTREGELYIQHAEGTTDRKSRIWISNRPVAGTGWAWELLTHIYELPNTVAQTSKINDFQPTQQTIAGNQIISFIDGGDQTPEQSGAKADYDGQFYIAVHTRTNGTKDVGIWVAEGNQWLPVQQDIETGTIVRTNKSNRFAVAEQILGEGGANARWLIGARVKFSGASPMADGNWRVQNIGEITIYENNTAVPRELSIWMGVSKNPSTTSNADEWALVWSNKTASLDNVAKTDVSNDFVPFQYINSAGYRAMINTGHEGSALEPKGRVTPLAPGDTFTQSYSHPSQGETRNIWMSSIEGDAQAWKRVLCADDHEVVLNDRPNNFLTKDNFIGSNTDTKRDRIMGARINNNIGPVYNGVAPTMFGEVVVCEEWDPNDALNEDAKIVKAYLAVGTGRKSWIEIGSRLKKDLEIIDDGTNN